jgi:hypothetical protein
MTHSAVKCSGSSCPRSTERVPRFPPHAAWGYRVDTMSAVSEPPNLPPTASSELVLRRSRVAARDVVFIKGICEASEGLCAMFAERGGDLVLSAPASRERELDDLVADLQSDFDAELE